VLGGLPEQNDKAIEDVEAVLDVAVEAVTEHLQDHLDAEQSGEKQVDVFQNASQG